MFKQYPEFAPREEPPFSSYLKILQTFMELYEEQKKHIQKHTTVAKPDRNCTYCRPQIAYSRTFENMPKSDRRDIIKLFLTHLGHEAYFGTCIFCIESAASQIQLQHINEKDARLFLTNIPLDMINAAIKSSQVFGRPTYLTKPFRTKFET